MVNEGSHCKVSANWGAPGPVGPLLHGRDSLWVFLLSIQSLEEATKQCYVLHPANLKSKTFFFKDFIINLNTPCKTCVIRLPACSLIHSPHLPCPPLHCRSLILQVAFLSLCSQRASGSVKPMGGMDRKQEVGQQREAYLPTLSFWRCVTFGSGFVSFVFQLFSNNPSFYDFTHKISESARKIML